MRVSAGWLKILAFSGAAGCYSAGMAIADGGSVAQVIGWFLAWFGFTAMFLIRFTYVE